MDLVHVALETIDTNNDVSRHKCITPRFPGEELVTTNDTSRYSLVISRPFRRSRMTPSGRT